MGDPLIAPAFVSFAVNELLKGVIKSAYLAYRYKDVCKELADRLEQIEPIVTKLGQYANNTRSAECFDWLMRFQDILESAEVLTNDCSEESRLNKTKRVLKVWQWKKLPTRMTKMITKIDKAVVDANLFVLDVILSTNARECASTAKHSAPNVGESLGFAKQATPSLIVGVEGHFNKLKTSILQSYGRMDRPSTFGLQGSGGAGKTLLAQMLNNDPDIKETYGEDSIVWITVGLDASVGALYDRMGKCSILGGHDSKRLELLHNKEDQRMLIIEAFSKKKVLLILDDVWEKQYDGNDMMYWLDVAKAPGSATLITTRSKPILCKGGAEVNVVLSLGDDDSWKLFCSHAFVNKAASLSTISGKFARAICKECKGLPLALKVIGSAMTDKESEEEWQSALTDLQQSTPILDSKVDVQLFDRLQWSYNELKNDATRVCFLYFAAFPEDHKIKVEDLINTWVGEELFGPDLNTEEAKKRAYDHLRVLEKRSLIDWKQGEKYAHIHDILRDLALYIIDNAKLGDCAYECLFYSDKPCISFPARKRVVRLKRMSFTICSISKWPKDLQIACSKVKVCIYRNTSIMKGRGSLDFLKNMVNLRVLDLSENSTISRRQLTRITNFAHLRKLNLSEYHSLSKLPSSIGKLKGLTVLDLSGCKSLTRLPKSIGNLECLTKLKLRGCGSLTGLPESIGNLECLTLLDLCLCRSLTGLPESIGNLECLTLLDLCLCRSLTGLPESIGNLKCLTKLNLSECGSLTGLPESIGNLDCLTKLDLCLCRSLTGLPESIGNLKGLTKLNLRECGSLTGLPESIGNLKCLTKLELYWCGSLTGLPENINNLECLTLLDLSLCGSLTGLPENISNLECLTVLDLKECGSLTGLPESIGNLKGLMELDLFKCRSLTGLPESIGNLKCLTKLKLRGCGSLTGLPESIGNLECLTLLDLCLCQSLTGLPESIGNLKCLTQLDLSWCGSLTRLPENISNLDCLTLLDLSLCGSLTGLPESIGNLKGLTKLNLRECGSLTRLPESIGNLECLTKLSLRECGSLTRLPESIGNLECLTKLDLSWCGSLTWLSESIGNLEFLTKLNLRGCGSLTGLPESIGNLKGLTELDLFKCGSLTGLPESIGNLKGLTKLDLSECRSLTRLPKTISNLKGLRKLDSSK